MAKYTVYQNYFHGGGKISSHRSLKAALRSIHSHECTECKCGGPTICKNDEDFPVAVIALDYYHHYQREPISEAVILAAEDYHKFID